MQIMNNTLKTVIIINCFSKGNSQVLYEKQMQKVIFKHFCAFVQLSVFLVNTVT
jgi:hypothetical protein